MSLQMRMYLLVALLFGVLYLIVLAVGRIIGVSSFAVYGFIALGLVVLQYLLGPALVSLTMRVKYIAEKDNPRVYGMVKELAGAARLPMPKVGISALDMPNAFAFGRTQGDARVCVTEGILRLLKDDELRAVLAHEISHIKHRDMAIITLLSIFPMIIYYVATSLMWSGFLGGDRRQGNNPLPLIGLGLLILHFFVQLLVLYGSRIREYYADSGAVQLGSQPQHLATALYKLVVGTARTPAAELKRVEGAKAFFVNDPGRALFEVRELKEIDQNMSGTIDAGELMALRSKKVNLGAGHRIMETLSTHPNMLKRIKHLSTLG
ncbi:MAG: M48 family metalloprotease [Chloroflexi bacterium]|nr:M48 family metalloprotease [Chloroflexota bacterium]